jgi:plasmid maintenance system antidote protein VapI
MKRLNNIHPGEILQEEFLIPLNISAYKLAEDRYAQRITTNYKNFCKHYRTILTNITEIHVEVVLQKYGYGVVKCPNLR